MHRYFNQYFLLILFATTLMHAGCRVAAPRGSVPRLNVMVANVHDGFDLYCKTLFARAWIRSQLSGGRFILVNAGSTQQLMERLETRLVKRKASLGTLWFDSHGHYENGFSSFAVGHERFDHQRIIVDSATRFLRGLQVFCGPDTEVLICSCYGGATYWRPGLKDSTQTYMYGDSLMVGLSALLGGVRVYASESWVMMKPGVFNEGYAFAGYPLGKKFTDSAFLPAWERMGIWNRYQPGGKVERIPTVSLDRWGNILVQQESFQTPKVKKRIQRKIARLKPGRYEFNRRH